MAEEQKDQSVNEEQGEETPAEDTETAQQAPEAEVEDTEPEAEVDERGVPWKNQAMEYKRKYQEMLERQQASQVQPPLPKQEEKYDPEQEVAKFAKDPKGYMESYIQRVEYQKNLRQAFDYVTEHGMDVQQINSVAADYGISNADPIRMVKKVKEILDLKKAATNPRSQQVVKKVDGNRTEKIKKTTTEAGSKPAEPKPKESEYLKEQFRKTGHPNDLAAYFRKRLDE